DKQQAINKYLLSAEDKRYVQPRLVVKSTALPRTNRLTQETFRARTRETNRFSTRVGPVLRTYFPRSCAQAAAKGFTHGSHYLRKVYANESFEVYQERVRQLTGMYVDKTIWSSQVLGHEGSIVTTLSYANVVVRLRAWSMEQE